MRNDQESQAEQQADAQVNLQSFQLLLKANHTFKAKTLNTCA